MKWQLLIAAPLLLAGCSAPTEAPAASTTTTSWTYTAPSTATPQVADQARQQIEDLQASWLPYVADVTFASGVLRVALQVDRNTDAELAGDIAKAIATNMRIQPIDGVDWVEVTDGAGTSITQESV